MDKHKLSIDIVMAKRKLYHLLLLKPAEDITPNEADIGYALVIDKDVQACFDKLKEDTCKKN